MVIAEEYRLGEGRRVLPDELELGPVHLKVADLDRSVAFYERVIGLVATERDASTVSLGGNGGASVLVLHERPGAQPARRHSGLYHVALLYESRQQLAEVGQRIQNAAVPIDGASDHGTHEAFYLPDPDRNGLELAWDRDPSVWPDFTDVETIAPQPLDVGALFNMVSGRDEVAHAGAGLAVGHIHLHVGEISDTLSFYRDVVGFDLIAELPDVAAFVSAGGYHHHLAFNTWQGRGAPPAPPDATGLLHWTIQLPGERDVLAVRGRVEAAGGEVLEVAGGVEFADPWGNRVRVVAPAAT